MPSCGTVFLVGAGPGDVGLFTLRGKEVLQQAEVVVYDYLANELLLQFAPDDAELIYVGKEASQHTKSQDEINAVLVEKAREGKRIVRLKGGDPFVFGRGGEEAIYLREHHVPFEVVPGITSAIAVPAYAGIPVTNRGISGGFHVVTGHESAGGKVPDVNWEGLAQIGGTIVFLMGVKNLPQIVTRLQAGGMEPTTPIALVRWGTVPEQGTVVSTLKDVVSEVQRLGFTSPIVGVVGEVVGLRRQMMWYESKPLFGVRAAVTRPRGEAEVLSTSLRSSGAEVVVTPTIRIKPAPLNDAMCSAFRELAEHRYQWVVFTSIHAVKLFFERLQEAGLDCRALAGSRVVAIGKRTARELKDCGIMADLVPEESRQEGICAVMGVHVGDRCLIPRALKARSILEQDLASRAVDVQVLPLYETRPSRIGITLLKKLLTKGRVQLVTFTSASTFEKLAEVTKPEDLPRLFSEVVIASIGPSTSEAIRKAGLTVHIESKIAGSEELADAIINYYNDKRYEATKTVSS